MPRRAEISLSGGVLGVGYAIFSGTLGYRFPLVRVIGVAGASFGGIFGCFALVWEVHWSSAYTQGVVWEVQRGRASVGLRPEWNLGNQGRMGIPTKGNKANSRVGSLSRGKQSQPCHHSNGIAATGLTICLVHSWFCWAIMEM